MAVGRTREDRAYPTPFARTQRAPQSARRKEGALRLEVVGFQQVFTFSVRVYVCIYVRVHICIPACM